MKKSGNGPALLFAGPVQVGAVAYAGIFGAFTVSPPTGQPSLSDASPPYEADAGQPSCQVAVEQVKTLQGLAVRSQSIHGTPLDSFVIFTV